MNSACAVLIPLGHEPVFVAERGCHKEDVFALAIEMNVLDGACEVHQRIECAFGNRTVGPGRRHACICVANLAGGAGQTAVPNRIIVPVRRRVGTRMLTWIAPYEGLVESEIAKAREQLGILAGVGNGPAEIWLSRASSARD